VCDPSKIFDRGNRRLTPHSRCSQYRGGTAEFHSCLNLSNPQMVTSTNPSKPRKSDPDGGPYRGALQRTPPQSVWKPPVNQGSDTSFMIHGATSLIFLLTVLRSPVHIMANPRRGRGGSMNGRGSGTPVPRQDAESSSDHRANRTQESRTPGDDVPNYRGSGGSRGSGTRGGVVRGVLGGRGGFTGGRGVNLPSRGGGGSRGRGRGQGALWNAS